MPLERIRVDGLRILRDVDCRLHPEQNYFFGPNGAGKTSLLEAVYLLGRGRSFRTRQTARLIQHGRSELSVFVEHLRGGEKQLIGLKYDAAGLIYRVDRQPVPGVTDVARLVRVDVIDPSIHRLIEAGPSERRRFLDWGVFHVEHGYLDAWKRYRRILGQRNAALKARASAATLAPWNAALVDAGQRVHEARAAFVAGLTPLVAEVGTRLLGRAIEIQYRRGWRADAELGEALAEALERDRAVGHTQVGPHRADLAVSVDGERAAEEASRGQQKLIAAALVMAEIRATTGADRADGILLVDDPAAELDRGAVGRLLAEVQSLDCQLLVTGLSEELVPHDSRFPVFHVEQGNITQ